MADFGSRNTGFFGGGGGSTSGVTNVSATTPLTSSGGATPDISITQSSSSVNGFLSSNDWTTFNNKPSNTDIILGYQGLGSTIKANPIGINLSLSIATVTILVDARLVLTPVYLSAPATITGVRWYQTAIGSYTADNYNGVGLYSVSGGTITLIASSTNDGAIWQTFGTNSWGNKAFSSPLSNQVAGTYFIGALWNASATTTAPSIATITSSSASIQAFDFTGGRLSTLLTAQTTLPTPLTLSTTTGVNVTHWLSLY